MVDLVKQLREGVEKEYSRESLETMLLWAADEIERLTELCDRYRKALEIIAGQPQCVLEAMQAKAALENIGPDVTNDHQWGVERG